MTELKELRISNIKAGQDFCLPENWCPHHPSPLENVPVLPISLPVSAINSFCVTLGNWRWWRVKLDRQRVAATAKFAKIHKDTEMTHNPLTASSPVEMEPFGVCGQC